ncbi:MAG: filamentous hemagglutinin N-terminal domain-containing protein [Cyanobacteriota bacterium]|nr:filamentous hemagglutinin N-terminal domain-containing protein [Cyanobacteriota bacterium]
MLKFSNLQTDLFKSFRFAPIAIFVFGWTIAPVQGQITPDATLPNNSIVLPNGNIFTIEGGTTAGSNLFHSFEDFSIPTGSEAFFNNALTIDNIITRITGSNISNIDGLIRANGAANLLLVNPNGIQFGPNARLEIGGSFLGSTAESLLFEDGSFYSTRETNTPPLLSVSVPIGLQMGTNPGAISLEGAIAEDSGISSVGEVDPLGLQVLPGRTLALVGGLVTISGSNLLAEAGRIEVGSVGGGSLLTLSPVIEGWTIDYNGATNFADIQIDGGSTLRVSGAGGGSIALAGGNITIDEESNLLAETLGSRDGGNITIAATEDIGIFQNSTVSATTFGSGNAGAVELEGRSIFLEGRSDLEAETKSRGNAGRVIATATDSILLDNRARVGTSTNGAGRGGFIDFSAETIVADNRSRFPNLSVRVEGVSNPDLPIGDAGQTNLTADTLIFRNRSGVNILTNTEGNGGELNISANTMTIEFRSFISAVSRGSGEGGTININADSLTIQNQSGMDSRSVGTGDGGRINIDAGSIFLEQGGFRTDTTGTGRGGEINVRAERIVMRDEGNIGSTSSGAGDAGTIRLEVGELDMNTGILELESTDIGSAGSLELIADSIRLDNEASIFATTIAGNGGNLAIEANELQLSNGSTITTSAAQTATGGNMRLDAEVLVLRDDSEIAANAVLGTGGNIDITTQGIFLSSDSQITASSQFGVDGIVRVNNPVAEPASGLLALSAEPLNPNTQIQNSCDLAISSRFAITGRGGLPEAPSQPIVGQTVWRDTRLGEISTDFAPNPIEVKPEVVFTPAVPLVEATGWIVNDRGKVELVGTSANPSHPSWQSYLDCDRTAATLPRWAGQGNGTQDSGDRHLGEIR